MSTKKKPRKSEDQIPSFNDFDTAYRAWLVRRGFPLPEKMTELKKKGISAKRRAAFFGGMFGGEA